jgi:hypothetical protein
MAWDTPYVIFRLSPAGSFAPVFQEADFQKAKYLLNFVAEPGDVLCRTPVHPKHSGKSPAPEYWSHKVKPGSVLSNEAEWRSLLPEVEGGVPDFPSAPHSE